VQSATGAWCSRSASGVMMVIGGAGSRLRARMLMTMSAEWTPSRSASWVLLAAIWWLWWRLPKRQVRSLDIQIHDPKARADTEDNFRKTVGQALGGAAVLIGAGAAYLQFTQQQQASRDLLISNQVAKGFEQLAGKEMTMRLDGLYALEGVMNTSSEYHQPVLEALCAFVREGTTYHQTWLATFLAAFFPTAPDKTAGHVNDAPQPTYKRHSR
jgi:hypothetical protein